ncbi:MAG: alpha/beta hydrolase [Anaerolineae bacterium]
MPSFASYLFKPLTRIISGRMDAISSIPKLRAFMEKGSGQPRLPLGFTTNTVDADGLPLEWISPSQVADQPIILYLHGGGWTLGWYNGHRSMVAHICQAAGCRALAVDYRLAPEFPYPFALDDCVKAYRWLVRSGVSPRQIVIAGDSAGGNLALATLMSLRAAGDPLPAAAVCISPMTDLACTGASFYSHKDVLLSSGFAQTMARHYTGSHDPRLHLISPHYGNLIGLPPLLIHVGQDEILLSDAVRLAEHARAAAVDVNLVIWPGMWHVWHTYIPYLPEARQAVEAIGDFIRRHTQSA